MAYQKWNDTKEWFNAEHIVIVFSLHVIIYAGRFAIGQREAALDIHSLFSLGTNSFWARSATVLSGSFFTYCSTLQNEKDKFLESK